MVRITVMIIDDNHNTDDGKSNSNNKDNDKSM